MTRARFCVVCNDSDTSGFIEDQVLEGKITWNASLVFIIQQNIRSIMNAAIIVVIVNIAGLNAMDDNTITFVSHVNSLNVQTNRYNSLWSIAPVVECSRQCLVNSVASEVNYYELSLTDGSKRWCVCKSGFGGSILGSDRVVVEQFSPRAGTRHMYFLEANHC